MTKKFRKIAVLLVFSSISSCATTMNSSDIEKYYKNFIGKKYYPETGMGDNWRLISADDDKLEFEYTVKGLCSYALTVNKTTNTFVDFRFTSNREACDNRRVFL